MADETQLAYSLRGVSRSFPGQLALRDLDLEIPAGQTVALVGPSGAGKTTLLRVLGGLAAPDRGTVTVHGRHLSALHPTRERPAVVGMMQQGFDLVPQLSVKHNVQAGLLGRWSLARSLAALVLPLEHHAARQALARVGLERRWHDRVGPLSGGEQQRVALARLLVQNSAILLADEPISSLDPALSDDLLGLLVGLARERNRTVVVSLHEPTFAVRHFERIVALRGGQIAFDLPSGRVTAADLEAVYALDLPEDRIADTVPTEVPAAGSTGAATPAAGQVDGKARDDDRGVRGARAHP